MVDHRTPTVPTGSAAAHVERDAAQAAALRANEGGTIGVPPWRQHRRGTPADESVEVPIRGNDLLNEDSYDSDTTRAPPTVTTSGYGGGGSSRRHGGVTAVSRGALPQDR